MKYIFIGDIHGKIADVEVALAKPGKKIFVGDFIDSFNHPVEDHEKCYDLVFQAIDKGEAEAIYGNHELSYLMPTQHRCSGYSEERQMLMTHYGPRIREKFKPYILLKPDLLVSHAGLTETLWRSFGLTFDNLSETLAEWWPDLRSPMHFIGRYRGGRNNVGGMFWCDYNVEFRPIEGLTQIFGHTPGRGIRHRANEYCIDCLDTSPDTFLELEAYAD